jgi:hypothetical protein
VLLGRSERAFILGALFPLHLDVERLRRLAVGGLRWGALAAAANRAGLAPAVAQAVDEAGVSDSVPAPVREALQGSLQRNAAQNAALLALLARAVATLDRAGVVGLPLKGSALLLREPGLVPLRNVSDIDLLVRREDVDLATAALVKCGWKKTSRLVEIDFRGRLLTQGAEQLDSPHGVTLCGETGLLLELHHALPSAHDTPREAGAAFFDRAEPLRWGRQEVRCPCVEDLLAVACEHVLAHHREQLIHQPRLVIDLGVLLAMGADPARARALWGPDVGAYIDEGLQVLEEARQAVAQPSLLGRGRAERVLSRSWCWLRAIEGRARQVKDSPAWLLRALRAHGWRALFPVRPYMVARYRVGPRSPLVPFLYIWRPIRWLIGIVTQR